jgi:hypothetical protein
MSGAIPLLSLSAFMAWTGKTFIKQAYRRNQKHRTARSGGEWQPNCLGEFSKNKRFEVTTTVDVKIASLWDVTQSSFVDM